MTVMVEIDEDVLHLIDRLLAMFFKGLVPVGRHASDMGFTAAHVCEASRRSLFDGEAAAGLCFETSSRLEVVLTSKRCPFMVVHLLPQVALVGATVVAAIPFAGYPTCTVTSECFVMQKHHGSPLVKRQLFELHIHGFTPCELTLTMVPEAGLEPAWPLTGTDGF